MSGTSEGTGAEQGLSGPSLCTPYPQPQNQSQHHSFHCLQTGPLRVLLREGFLDWEKITASLAVPGFFFFFTLGEGIFTWLGLFTQSCHLPEEDESPAVPLTGPGGIIPRPDFPEKRAGPWRDTSLKSPDREQQHGGAVGVLAGKQDLGQ